MFAAAGKNILTENMIEEEQKIEEDAKIADEKMLEVFLVSYIYYARYSCHILYSHLCN